jgi:hypothetical protein
VGGGGVAGGTDAAGPPAQPPNAKEPINSARVALVLMVILPLMAAAPKGFTRFLGHASNICVNVVGRGFIKGGMQPTWQTWT